MQITAKQSSVALEAATGGVRIFYLHKGEVGRPPEGEVVLRELATATTHTIGSGDRESGSVLLAGAAEILIDGVAYPLSVGAIVQTPPAATFQLRTTDHAATVLSILGVPPAQTSGASATGIRTARVEDAAEIAAHLPERGFFHMHARMLIDHANGAAGAFTLGQGRFAPDGGCHALHRHPGAAEVFYIWSGEGVHLSEDGAEHPMRVGDLAYVARNEWHGFRNTGPSPVRALFGYLGANSRESAGYELPVANRSSQPKD
jgi:mannose-6-phosphate isomerase-like protein (cupin superfamily)